MCTCSSVEIIYENKILDVDIGNSCFIIIRHYFNILCRYQFSNDMKCVTHL